MKADNDIVTCTWEEDADGAWDTACYNKFVLVDGTPADNGIKYCCYCGRMIKEVWYQLDEAAR